LRLLKSQHEELRAQLTRAEGQLRRLSPHAVFQLRSYLERQFTEPDGVQEAFVRLLECLCAVCRIEIGVLTADSLLSGVRKLLRDPHSFTSRLCSIRISCEEAKGLAPYLSSGVQFKRAREKEVNTCYDAFHSWLSSFYLFSVVSDQVKPVAQDLEKQESLLRRLQGQADESGYMRGKPLGGVTRNPNPPRTRAGAAVGGSAGQAGSVAARSGGVSSPLGRSRSALDIKGTPRVPKSSPIGTRSRIVASSAAGSTGGSAAACSAVGTTSPERSAILEEPPEGVRSRSHSPGQNSQAPSSSTTRARRVTNPSGPGLSSSWGSSCGSSRVAAGSARAGAAVSSTLTTQGSVRRLHQAPGLARVGSDMALPRATSPGAGRKGVSRDPSPGGRHSPDRQASVPSTAPSHRGPGLVARVAVDTRRGSSPTRSEHVPRVTRMASAPTTLDRVQAVEVRTRAGPLPSRTVATNSATNRASIRCVGSGVAPPMSPDKGAGAPRPDHIPRAEATAEATPEDTYRDSGPASIGEVVEHEDEEEDGVGTPRRRRLSLRQYEQLVRCAQLVVSGNTIADAPAPAPVSRPAYVGPVRGSSSALNGRPGGR
jgi:hypothetical protein